MLRTLLLLWALPMVLFWGWFALSAVDASFGTVYFSRALHDTVMAVYGQSIGVPAEQVPWLIASACILDTLIVFGAVTLLRKVASRRARARLMVRARRLMTRINPPWRPLRESGLHAAGPAHPAR